MRQYWAPLGFQAGPQEHPDIIGKSNLKHSLNWRTCTSELLGETSICILAHKTPGPSGAIFALGKKKMYLIVIVEENSVPLHPALKSKIMAASLK